MDCIGNAPIRVESVHYFEIFRATLAFAQMTVVVGPR
jgi:hypothetical protein